MMQAWSVKGGQQKYTGHCCNFIRDTASFIRKIPLLPEHIDTVIIRPKSTENAERPALASSDCFHVKRERVIDNLRVLQQFHPTFRDRPDIIDYDVLNSLPEDGSVYDRLHSVEAVTVTSDPRSLNNSNDDNDEISNLTSNGFVPSLQSNEREITELQNALQITEDILTMPAVHGAAINEHDPNIQYMRDAFATLFPTGKADYHTARPHNVTAQFYFEHLMRYKDGRFAKHPRFRYFAWNSLLRWNAKKRTRVFAKRNLNDEIMTVGNEV
jgi:hypothetical protein